MNAVLNAPTAPPLRVLVADDSTLMRKLIGSIVRGCPSLQLAGEACDGLDALDKAEALHPDVILLDIEMPRLDGLGFLAEARLRTAASVIVVSSVAEPGSAAYRSALDLGAVDIVAKPSGVLSVDIAERRRAALIDAIERCRVQRPVAATPAPAPVRSGNDLVDKLWPDFELESAQQLAAIGSALASQGRDADGVALYRHFHTLKGGCALMGFANLQALALACEDLLRPVRDGQGRLDDAMVEALAAAQTWLQAMVADMAADHADPAPATALLERLGELRPAA